MNTEKMQEMAQDEAMENAARMAMCSSDDMEHCDDCNGTGEGMHADTTCQTCKGSGEVPL